VLLFLHLPLTSTGFRHGPRSWTLMALMLLHYGASILATCRCRQDIQEPLHEVLSADLYTRMAFCCCCCFVLLHFCCSVCSFSSSYKYPLAFLCYSPSSLMRCRKNVERYSWEACYRCASELATRSKGRNMLDETVWSNCIGCFFHCLPLVLLLSQTCSSANSDGHVE
jgi:hypothetical protein